MDGLRAIIHYCGKRDGSISTSERGAMITALPRSGSSSSISTGRDALTKEVRNLQEAFAGIDFRNRSAAGRNDDDTIADSFAGDAQVLVF
ncbi:hypothetical protein ANCCAN_09788 [Ancylostoma caninum]|uniref:Uncharacterized protein n=1 Tax=Ancylostoma caninum TaxID=29170 RepID=A0A368GMJ5_ANCCA|nr:hypothetical protein ANCCAN_09788 [Ancylostoma caninum]